MSHGDLHAHGHGDDPASGAAASASHGPAEPPPVPDPRMITPAREDYARPFPGAGLLWPLVWLVFAIVLWQGASRWNGPIATHEGSHEGGESPAPPHGD